MTIHIDEIQRVMTSLAPYILRTPVRHCESLSRPTNASVYLKCEHFQRTGSFKFRGALAAAMHIRRCSTSAAWPKLLTASAGNHGIGLAAAAATLGMKCGVAVPRNAPARKTEAIRRLGADLIIADADGYDQTQQWLLENVDRLGGTFVSGFDHDPVIMGNGGTTMLELVEQSPPFDSILIPTGGGGLAAGMGVAASAMSDQTRIIAVNAEGSPAMLRSIQSGTPHLHMHDASTIADGLAGGVGARAFAYCREVVHEVRSVTDREIQQGMKLLDRHESLVVEPSAAVTIPALLQGGFEGQRVCLILTGRNVDWKTYRGCTMTPPQHAPAASLDRQSREAE